jgi:hypothetical protein
MVMIYLMILWCITHAVWAGYITTEAQRYTDPKWKVILTGVVMCPFIVLPVISFQMIAAGFKEAKEALKRLKEEW